MDLTAELQRARAHTDSLFTLVADQTLYQRPIPDRHRLIFYVGHLDAFDWNHLARGVLGLPSFDAAFDQLFEAGIDPPPGQAPQDTAADWPAVDAVRGYVARTRAGVDKIWPRVGSHMQQMVIEHRWMHAETVCYLLHQLDPALKNGAPARVSPGNGAHRTEFITVAAGATQLGQANGEFGWDNEFPAHRPHVPAFEISKHKVTNAEYLRFLEDGGPVPPFWRRHDGRWHLRRMFDEVPLPHDSPVYTTHQQASAYAQWADAALPTEAQWHRAAYADDGRPYPWGAAKPVRQHGNFDFAAWAPVPVTEHPAGDSPYGVRQMIGNGWEWTSTPFAGFKGFEARPYYSGYSANFFDADHYVLKGGSPRTASLLLRKSFRNWYRTEYPYVYGTIRLARQ